MGDIESLCCDYIQLILLFPTDTNYMRMWWLRLTTTGYCDVDGDNDNKARYTAIA